jgi:hypothetical protein
LIALDTNVPGHHAEYLCAERLRWLEDRLVEAPARATIVIGAYDPVTAIHDGEKWLP